MPGGSPGGSPAAASFKTHKIFTFCFVVCLCVFFVHICAQSGGIRIEDQAKMRFALTIRCICLELSTKWSGAAASGMRGSIALNSRATVGPNSDHARGTVTERPYAIQMTIFAGPFLGRFLRGVKRDGEMQHGVSCWTPFWDPVRGNAKKPRIQKTRLDPALLPMRDVDASAKAALTPHMQSISCGVAGQL